MNENVRVELQLVGELENLLVDQIVAASWRLRRLRRVEARIFAWQPYGELLERAQGEAETYERSAHDNFLENHYGLFTRITDERKH